MIVNEIYDITKEYDEMYKVIIYKSPFNRINLKKNNSKKKIIRSQSEDSLQRSVRRSKAVISDYCGVNRFEWFVTFTFNPLKVDRYDLNACYVKMQGWLWRTSRKYPDFKYIIVPEKHKDGAIHFHALIAGYDGNMKKTNVLQNSKRVYNITGFTYGFTNAQRLDDDMKKTIAYLCKYITKDMSKVHNRRRYWCSKSLRKPEKYYNAIYDLGVYRQLTPKNLVNETDYNTIYSVPKDLVSEMA